MDLSPFVLSQVLVSVAILFDLLSFQCKLRKHILGCLVIAGLFISAHFFLLKQWTAACLMLLAVSRYLTSIICQNKRLQYGFMGAAVIVSVITFTGALSLLSVIASCLQTKAAFCQQDKKLRLWMMLGTSVWLLHNVLAHSPTAVLMEALFIGSNIMGYYRFHIAKTPLRLL